MGEKVEEWGRVEEGLSEPQEAKRKHKHSCSQGGYSEVMKQLPSSLLPLANSPVHFSSPGKHQKSSRKDHFYPDLFY